MVRDATPIQRRRLTHLNRLKYVDDDVLFNTIKMGLNKGYNEYLRSIGIHQPYQDSLTEREIIHHIIECDPINNNNDLENHYKDYYIDFLDSAGLKNINKKSKLRKSKSKRRKSKRKSKSKRRKSKTRRRRR